MKIGFIAPSFFFASHGGVKLQALMWKKGLEMNGHQVDLINVWDNNKWTDYNAFIIFGYGGCLRDIVNKLYNLTHNIYLAPIIDTNYPVSLFNLAAKYLKIEFLRLHSQLNDLYEVKDKIKLYYSRSEYESKFINKGLNIESNKIVKIPLSYRIPEPKENSNKENFCFHTSLLTNPGKNVHLLIKAAQKYQFKLKLAGYLRDEYERELLNSWINNSPNIEYVGFLSEEELLYYYSKAKVFALPSTYEGVGMVALEAARYGCNIVLTQNGGPKEYFNNQAFLVNPQNIDSIGLGIINALRCNDRQPQLAEYIRKHYNFNYCSSLLHESVCK